MSNTSKTGSRKTTFVLSAILVLLVLFALTVFVIIPAYNHYYITHIQYPVYGGMTDELKDSELYKDLQSGKTICFLGDSITSGAETNGIAWYHPLIPYIKGERFNISRGGWMVYHLLEQKEQIPVADVYVIAIGVNDIVFSWGSYAAHTPEDFAERIGKLAENIRSASPDAKIYFVSPWIYFDKDAECNERGVQYRAALNDWCDKNGCICIDPEPVLESIINSENRDKYMFDYLHPNAPEGIGLYSYAVLKSNHDQTSSTLPQDK